MRVFQNIGVYRGYFPRLQQFLTKYQDFEGAVRAIVDDRVCASQMLKPVLDGDASAFVAVGHYQPMQVRWARAKGMPRGASLEDILLAQIEEHRTEVFFNLDPVTFGDAFVGRLPGSVRTRIAWRAAPSPHGHFGKYDLVVNNFPGILTHYAEMGMRTAYFFPAHDPEADAYARNEERPVDVLFAGGYTQYHRRRARILEAAAGLSREMTVHFHLDRSRLTRLAETPLGAIPGLSKLRRPEGIRAVSRPAVFGRELYAALGSAKIVLNAAIDMAGDDRGNMRCFEAMSCGAALLSDAGRYPEGMTPGGTLISYRSPEDAVSLIRNLRSDPASIAEIARRGAAMIRERYSKERQWALFERLCDR